jgi:hypothetical protein
MGITKRMRGMNKMITPLSIVLDCIEAHNQHDIVRQKSYFTDSCQWFLDDGTCMLETMENFIPWYSELLKRSPKMHIEVKNQLVVGEVVVLEELVSGQVTDKGVEVPPYYCISTYRITDNKISNKRVYGPLTK